MYFFTRFTLEKKEHRTTFSVENKCLFSLCNFMKIFNLQCLYFPIFQPTLLPVSIPTIISFQAFLSKKEYCNTTTWFPRFFFFNQTEQQKNTSKKNTYIQQESCLFGSRQLSNTFSQSDAKCIKNISSGQKINLPNVVSSSVKEIYAS